ncbi:MAG: imidazole glycerol phosphate synthase subunit HisH [Gammaproteobacteria bacterium]|nr:imidazole glycerol phosphate synthase subunit HisH [Gammaproteobacteria bacterium]
MSSTGAEAADERLATDPVVIGGCGANLASLAFALERLGFVAPVTEDPERVLRASHVILPGVGAARDAMERLERTGMAEIVPHLTRPVLGICLGMQLLFEASEEDDAECLGVIPATVRRLPRRDDLPVPHMGWNELALRRQSPLLDGVADGGYAYFVHSYAAPVGDYTCAVADYGGEFSAVVEQANFFGAQFHPERSSRLGARLLQNFLSL